MKIKRKIFAVLDQYFRDHPSSCCFFKIFQGLGFRGTNFRHFESLGFRGSIFRVPILRVPVLGAVVLEF